MMCNNTIKLPSLAELKAEREREDMINDYANDHLDNSQIERSKSIENAIDLLQEASNEIYSISKELAIEIENYIEKLERLNR